MLAIVVVTALLSAGLATGPSAPVKSVPAPKGLEKKLIADAQDGKLDTVSLLDAALIASGVADADVATEAKRVRLNLAPAIARAKTRSTARERGDALLRALHETLFRTYAIGATEIDGAVRTGEYNCLSSAVLYVVAAEGLVDDARAMVSRHHAFARVIVDGKPVDVETTTPMGFGADRKKLMTPEFVRRIAGRDTTPAEMLADLQSPEELPLLSLVAGVYSNRAVGLAARGDLATATIALDRAARLASGGLKSRAAAWRAGVLNDGALALADEGRLADARLLLEIALEGTEGETRRLVAQNLAVIHLQMADAALAKKDWTGALAAVDGATKVGARPEDTAQLRARANAALAALDGTDARCAVDKSPPQEAATCLAALARELRDRDVDAALQHARRAFTLAPDNGDAVRALFFTLAGKIRVESDRAQCDDVEALVREALPHIAVLDGQKWVAAEVMASCWARAGDAAFDKKDWDTASRTYARARTHLPKDASLKQNLAAVDLNRAIELAKDGNCDQARPFAKRAVKNDAALDDKSERVLESCAAVRAKSAADAKDWDRAAAELRRGLRDAPNSKPLAQNLATMLHNIAVAYLRDKKCDDARALLPELDALDGKEAAEAIRTSCPR